MEENEVRIYFGGDLTNLYEIGWLSSDLSQVIDFSELLELEDFERTEKFFGEKARPFNRFTKVVNRPHKRPEIIDVRKGSVELVLGGVTVAAAILMPLVQIYAQRYFEQQNEEVSFEVSPQDKSLKRILDAYARGEFGRGSEGLSALFSLLEIRNYDVRVLSQNVYLVEHVVERYAQRIVRTIKKNRPDS
ncbi:hypothetical protein [Vibrio alginolyticus]|uniref:hypothetical protein n=1 Tax=Vibrio alginolyticus TaxID=663 RepID=UPI00215BE451|nr:hypothetical protein [Vibrio alginolyticus]MCR9537260.1 hypothetical protein [Vibrio alginolyticus]